MGFMAGPRLRKFLDPHVPDPPVQRPEKYHNSDQEGPVFRRTITVTRKV